MVRIVYAASLFFGLLLVVGCSARTADVKIDGSSTVYPISEAVAEQHRIENGGGTRVTVGFSGTGGGMKKFYAGEIDICDASREMKDSEREKCEEAGVEFLEFKVALDGVAIIVNPENDWCDCLTVAQLKEMWRPESPITKWSDLDPEWPAEDIDLYGPGADSGTFDYFTEVIVGEEKSSRSDYTGSENDNMLVKGTSGDQYSLGYVGFAYYYENRDSLKLLGVDDGESGCMQPSIETVRANTYAPLSRPLYIYVRKSSLERPKVAEFVKFYLDNAAAMAKEVQYVPVSDEVAATNQETLSAAFDDLKAKPAE